jgi:hypothetical protein
VSGVAVGLHRTSPGARSSDGISIHQQLCPFLRFFLAAGKSRLGIGRGRNRAGPARRGMHRRPEPDRASGQTVGHKKCLSFARYGATPHWRSDVGQLRLFAWSPISSIFLSQQTNHQWLASSTLLSEQTSIISHQSPPTRTGCIQPPPAWSGCMRAACVLRSAAAALTAPPRNIRRRIKQL